MLVVERNDRIQRVHKNTQGFISKLHSWQGSWYVGPYPTRWAHCSGLWIKGWIRWNEKRKERKNGHQSWFQCWSSWWDVQGSRPCVQTWLGIPFNRQVSHFLRKLVVCRMFFQTFLDVGQGALRFLSGLDLPLCSVPSCNLLLCFTVLCLSPGIRTRMFGLEKWCPAPTGLPATPCSFLWPVTTNNSCLFIANKPWLPAQPPGYRVWDSHTSPLSSGILQGGSAQRWKVEQIYWKPEQSGKNTLKNWQHNSNELHFESQDTIRL